MDCIPSLFLFLYGYDTVESSEPPILPHNGYVHWHPSQS